MKTKYWIINNGVEEKGTAKDFKYYYNDFCKSVMDDKGNVFDKGGIPLKDVALIYNPQGIAIAGRN
jgi:hypothetical protein